MLLVQLPKELRQLQSQIEKVDEVIMKVAGEHTAAAIVAAVIASASM
ncbi:MAG: hypothetical protein ACRD3F_08875 [Acidobacteriaceae bacterium]